jgi:hypothetical protein
MKLTRLSLAAMAFKLFFLMTLFGCGGGRGGGEDGQQTTHHKAFVWQNLMHR